jgi:hypothetical protein
MSSSMRPAAAGARADLACIGRRWQSARGCCRAGQLGVGRVGACSCLAVGRARLVEEEVKPRRAADRDPEPKEITLSVPGHDLAQEHHRQDRDDQPDQLALQVT